MTATAQRTAGLPLLGLAGFLVHLAIFVTPLSDNAYGPGVPLGWPPRLLLLSYMVWLITLAWQAIRLTTYRPDVEILPPAPTYQ